MQKLKKHLLLFIIHLIVCLFLIFLFHESLTLLVLINFLFYLTIFYLLIGLYLYVMSRQFFDITAKGFRRVFSGRSKTKDLDELAESRKLPSEKVNKAWISFFLIQGSLLIFSMILLLVFYYY
ncbi:DUF3899 domain-containing protein [Gracilibacillus boraciitolerans]|uniref:DUF3899 domain-containing protein n=1 Tax=Gracilibacillus boraciitolerans TaxID=307521 RepID=UPI00068DEA6B